MISGVKSRRESTVRSAAASFERGAVPVRAMTAQPAALAAATPAGASACPPPAGRQRRPSTLPLDFTRGGELVEPLRAMSLSNGR